jgi:hypothetical protein
MLFQSSHLNAGVTSNRSFDTDARRRFFASLRTFPPVAGQLQRYATPR